MVRTSLFLPCAVQPDFIHVKGTITHIKHDLDPGPWYPACPGINPASQRPCNKKLIDEVRVRACMLGLRLSQLTSPAAHAAAGHWRVAL